MRYPLPAIICLVSIVCPLSAPAADGLVAFPENGGTLSVLLDGESYLEVALMGWEPNWKFMGFRGEVRQESDGSTTLANSAKAAGSGAQIALNAQIEKTGPRQLTFNFDLRADRDTPLVYIIAALEMADAPFEGGKILATHDDGAASEVSMPLEKKGVGPDVRRMTLVDAAGRETRVTFATACNVQSDGVARIVLAGDLLSASKPSTLTMTIDLPDELTYHAGAGDVPFEPGFEDWFEFQPDADHTAASEISMRDWLDAPAGRHGRVTRRGDQLLVDGKPIKLWGLNLCYGACAPDRELADRQADFYAKYGINAVRLHKYADGAGWAGIQSEDSFVELDPEGLDRMDYFVAQLKKRGIYVKFSAHFGSQKLGAADRKYVPYMDEFGQLSGRNARVTTPHSAVHYSPELQDVQIRQMVNLLEHKNPYTGMTYAADPGVAFVEIINEQSILFYSSMNPLKASPTLRRHVAGRFCDWLRQKYGTQAKLESAWGGRKAFDGFVDDGFPAVGESLDENNILPLGNPWYWDPDQLAGSQAFRKRRLLDTLRFLYELQNEFYARYVAAMREAGYEGEIVSSNWQAGRAFSHLHNLHSDALVGTVDRHNYFGGGSSSRIDNATMLALPGSGLLSSGMQQVADRPFMLSEWIHVAPNEWGVEGPAVIGAYAMGLQGWDVSFMFQNRDAGVFSGQVGRDRWDVTAPQVLGVFPAVARQVLRGDVREAEVVAAKYVHMPSLSEGKLGFEDRVAQQHDVKTFDSDKTPAEMLAVGRCVVEFTDTYRETPAVDASRFLRDGAYMSSTNQLRWTPGKSRLDGFFTLDTDATKAVVGFADGRECALGDVTIEPDCRYAAIYLTAKEPDRDLVTSNSLLVVAMARARNSGMKVFAENRILDRGSSPVLLEPVRATITLARSGDPTVYLLDHSGRRTEKTLPVVDGQFEIDGARDKTCYYMISY